MTASQLVRKVRLGFWHLRHTSRIALAERLARRNDRISRLSRLIRYPLPSQAPYRRPRIHLLRAGALGDVLMCTPALRRLRELNPDCHVTFYTKYTMLLDGLPYVDTVRQATDPLPPGTIRLEYEGSLPVRRHIAKVFGDHLGLEVADVRPSCSLDSRLRDEFRARFDALPHPWIVVSRHTGPWTQNRAWPQEHWDVLIERLLGWATIIDVSMEAWPRAPRDPRRYLNLAGRLGIEQLIAAIAAADLHVGPNSGPLHIAAAFHIPAVVIYGGYLEPSCCNYEGNIDLYSPVPCSPCWLNDPCPYGLPCMHQISPTAVESALMRLWEARQSSSNGMNPSSRGVLSASVMSGSNRSPA